MYKHVGGHYVISAYLTHLPGEGLQFSTTPISPELNPSIFVSQIQLDSLHRKLLPSLVEVVETIRHSESSQSLLLLTCLRERERERSSVFHTPWLPPSSLTSSRNLGLSGSRKYSRAPMSEGRAVTAMYTLQLWMVREPMAILTAA